MKRRTISTKKEYTTKSGEQKTFWRRVGEITEFDDGGLSLELYMFPDTKFFVFDDEQKSAPQQPQQAVDTTTDIPY